MRKLTVVYVCHSRRCDCQGSAWKSHPLSHSSGVPQEITRKPPCVTAVTLRFKDTWIYANMQLVIWGQDGTTSMFHCRTRRWHRLKSPILAKKSNSVIALRLAAYTIGMSSVEPITVNSPASWTMQTHSATSYLLLPSKGGWSGTAFFCT